MEVANTLGYKSSDRNIVLELIYRYVAGVLLSYVK